MVVKKVYKKNQKKIKSLIMPIKKEDISLPKGTPRDTSKIVISKGLINQVIGQEESVKIIRKAAAQKRNVLLVGIPGTGKSLLAAAMSEILPIQKLQDVLVYPNDEDANNPKVVTLKTGNGKKIVEQSRLETRKAEDSMRLISFLLPIGWMLIAGIFWQIGWYSDVIFAALLLIGAVLLIGLSIGGQMRSKDTGGAPKLLINNFGRKSAPFFEGTGSRAGALLGDVRHDPLQCHYGFNDLYLKTKEGLVKKPFAELWDEMTQKYGGEIIKTENEQEALFFPPEEQVYTLGEKEGKIVFSKILSMNRQPYKGKLVEFESEGKKVILTPEHKVFSKGNKKEAGKISFLDKLTKLVAKESQEIELST
jgi:ATP-dependent Lon protease